MIKNEAYYNKVYKEWLHRLKTDAVIMLVAFGEGITVDQFMIEWKKAHPYASPYRHRIRRWIRRYV